MLKIELTKGKWALIDDLDLGLISCYEWYALETEDGMWYAAHKSKAQLLMHRIILGAQPGQEVDHKDYDGLNNQRSNIRLCTPTQNRANTRKRSNVTSKYKGVSWYRNYGKWRATISACYIQTTLGYFNSEVDAALAYNKAALELFGEFARINIIQEDHSAAHDKDTALRA